ncbi:MAG: 30S ribosomal protein S20 [Planctomycetota bacterium]|nr:30S ribosomal protein S20 [Planctomycetota bacterium]
MPTTSSAKKRLRQNTVRRTRNRAVKSALKTQLRKVREPVEDGNIPQAEAEYREAAKKLDREGARNVIHRNKAARTKSRLQKLIKKAKQSAATPPA